MVRSFAVDHPRYAAQPSSTESSEPTEGLVINVNPHSSPYPHQSLAWCFDSASSSVAQKSVAPSSAARHVSHTHSNGIMTALGKNAQSHAAPLATAPEIRL